MAAREQATSLTSSSEFNEGRWEHLIKTCQETDHVNEQTYHQEIEKIIIGHYKNPKVKEKMEYVLLPALSSKLKSPTTVSESVLQTLGTSLQFCQLEKKEENKIIRVLLNLISNESLSQKAIRCLSNVQLQPNLPDDIVKEMLGVASTCLSDPTASESHEIITGVLKLLKNIYTQNPEFVEDYISRILNQILPLLFHDSHTIRECSLELLHPLASVISNKQLLKDTFAQEYITVHHKSMILLVTAESTHSLMIWRFLVMSFGDYLHRDTNLLNSLLKIEELALKSANYQFRLCGLESWRWMIDCFSRNQELFNCSKRLKLIMIPFIASESKTGNLAETKIKLWWYLLGQLGDMAENHFEEVTLVCLHFCFGGQKYPYGAVDSFPHLMTAATVSFIGILSPETVFDRDMFKRSNRFLSTLQFLKNIEEIRYISERVCSKLDSGKESLFCDLFSIFIRRCADFDQYSDEGKKACQQLASFTRYLIELARIKPAMSSIIIICFQRLLDKPLFFHAFLSNFSQLLKWPSLLDNQYPTEKYEELLNNFFEIGISSQADVIPFAKEIASAMETVKASLRSVLYKVSLARHWSLFVNKILNKLDTNVLLQVDTRLLFFPVPLACEIRMRCDDVWNIWAKYMDVWFFNDSSFFVKFQHRVVQLMARRKNDIMRIEILLTFAIKIALPYLQRYEKDIIKWANDWFLSWINTNNAAKIDLQKNCEILADFFIFLIQQIPEDFRKILFAEIVSLLKSHSSDNIKDIVRFVEKIIRQKSGLSCLKYFDEHFRPDEDLLNKMLDVDNTRMSSAIISRSPYPSVSRSPFKRSLSPDSSLLQSSPPRSRRRTKIYEMDNTYRVKTKVNRIPRRHSERPRSASSKSVFDETLLEMEAFDMSSNSEAIDSDVTHSEIGYPLRKFNPRNIYHLLSRMKLGPRTYQLIAQDVKLRSQTAVCIQQLPVKFYLNME